MPWKMAGANGLWSASSWKTLDAAVRSMTGNQNILVTETITPNFSVVGGDYDAIVLFIAWRAVSPSGTITVRLLKGGVFVSGTSVTINVADLPPMGTTAQADIGYVCFAWPALVNLATASDYSIGVISSAATQIGLYRDGTVNNFSRGLRFAALSTVAAADDMLICGERTGPGAMTSREITYDVTTTTDWGSASAFEAQPAIAIGEGGTLQSQLNSATNYRMTVSGRFHLHWGGRFDIGTQGTPLPSDSTFFLLFDNTVNVDFGFTAYSQYTLNMCHVKGFAVDGNGDANTWAFLTSNLAAGQGTGAGSIAVENTTGWAVNDAIEIPSTRASGSGDDSLTVAAIASGTTLSSTANATFLHDGSAIARTPRAAVVNRTRGIFIYSTSITLQAFWSMFAANGTATIPRTVSCYMRGVVFANMGSATTNKRGWELASSGGSFEFDECVWRNFEVASSSIRITIRNSTTTMLFKNCITFRISQDFALSAPSTAGDFNSSNRVQIYHCLFQRSLTNPLFVVNWPRFDVQRCVFSRSTNQGVSFAISENWLQDGTNIFRDNEIHIGANNGGMVCTGAYAGTIENLYLYRTTGGNVNSAALSLGFSPIWGELLITGLKVEGATSGARAVSLVRGYYRLVNPEITGDAVAGNIPVGIGFAGAVNSAGGSMGGELIVENGSILQTTTILQAELYSSCRVTLEGVTTTIAVDNASFYNNPTRMLDGYVQVLNHNNVAGQDRVWVPNGRSAAATFVPDTTNFNTTSPSLAIYPGVASAKIKSPKFSVAVAQGQTATPSVRVREDAAYNGNPARLCVRRNALAGISSDTVIATHSGTLGIWETLTGTTAAVARDCILEFYIDCDGTAGFINVDDFSCNSADTRGMQFYSENKLSPWVVGGSTGGGATGFPLSRLVT